MEHVAEVHARRAARRGSPAVRGGQRRNLDRMLDEDFDTLLFAHTAPVLSGGHGLLRDFLAGCK